MADLHLVQRTQDESCPLVGTEGHVCRSRDWVERETAGFSPLRPEGDCFEGAYYHLTVEAQARMFTAQLADKVGALLAAARLYGYDRGDLEVEVFETAAALGLQQAAVHVAGWDRP